MGPIPESARSRCSFALIETALGTIGVAWSADGLTRLQLPEADAVALEERLARTAGRADVPVAPRFVQEAVERLESYAAGGRIGFDGVPLDLTARTSFEQAVYRLALGVPYGRTTTYGDIARTLGDVGHARAVGQALGRNPLAIIVPCHRVLAAGGKPGGFSAYGGRVTKARLLELEGAFLPGLEPTFPGLDLPISGRKPSRSER